MKATKVKEWLTEADYNHLVSEIKKRGYTKEDCGNDYNQEPNENLLELVTDMLTEFNERTDDMGNYDYPGLSNFTITNFADSFVNWNDELASELSE